MVTHKTLFAVALFATATLSLSSPGSAESDTVGEPREVTGTAVAQTYQDGPDGTVFTLTDIETLEGESVTVRTKGGIHSDGIGQYTSHQAELAVGGTYRMQIVASVDPTASTQPTDDQDAAITDAVPQTFSVIGGQNGVQRVSLEGALDLDESQSTPDNFVRLSYDWNWTLPDNPPVYLINPNTGDVGNEEALIRAAFDAWEDDPGSSMDWTYGGTTSVTTVANDGVNAVFWADTPDPADGFLAQSTTFFNPDTGQAVSTDIHFNNDFRWSDGAVANRFDILSVGIHEAGHSLGLGHAPEDTAIMFRSTPSNTVKRELSLGDRGGLAAIYPPSASVGESVSGQVAFNDGGPAPDVRLNLYTENRAQFLVVDFTDTEGNYAFDLPSSGCYVLTFVAPTGTNFVPTGTGFLNQPFCAASGQAVTGIDAQLVDPSDQATFGGEVTNPDGSAEAGVRAVLYQANDDSSRGSWVGPDFTDDNGSYRFTQAPGCYVIDLVAPDGRNWADSGSGFARRSICVGTAETNTSLDAVLNE